MTLGVQRHRVLFGLGTIRWVVCFWLFIRWIWYLAQDVRRPEFPAFGAVIGVGVLDVRIFIVDLLVFRWGWSCGVRISSLCCVWPLTPRLSSRNSTRIALLAPFTLFMLGGIFFMKIFMSLRRFLWNSWNFLCSSSVYNMVDYFTISILGFLHWCLWFLLVNINLHSLHWNPKPECVVVNVHIVFIWFNAQFYTKYSMALYRYNIKSFKRINNTSYACKHTLHILNYKHVHLNCLNKFFNLALKVCKDLECLISAGKRFHSVGPMVPQLLSVKVLRLLKGTM